MKKFTALFLALSIQTAFAGSLSITEYDTVQGEKIPKIATLNEHTLTKVGSGIRQKKILFVGVNVYRTTLLASEPAGFARDIKASVALDSLQNMKARALQLQFMRDVAADDIVKSFETALEKNGVAETPFMAQFKAAIQKGGNIKSGHQISIAADKEKGVLAYEHGSNRVEIKGNDQFFRDVFSIWLGKPADSGLEQLRNVLIKG